jgi:hypothetical protein
MRAQIGLPPHSERLTGPGSCRWPFAIRSGRNNRVKFSSAAAVTAMLRRAISWSGRRNRLASILSHDPVATQVLRFAFRRDGRRLAGGGAKRNHRESDHTDIASRMGRRAGDNPWSGALSRARCFSCFVPGSYAALHHRLQSAAPPAQRLVGKLMAYAPFLSGGQTPTYG